MTYSWDYICDESEKEFPDKKYQKYGKLVVAYKKSSGFIFDITTKHGRLSNLQRNCNIKEVAVDGDAAFIIDIAISDPCPVYFTFQHGPGGHIY